MIHSLLTSAATSAKRKTAVALISVLAVAAGGTIVYAASGKADFGVVMSPTSRTIPQGQVASFTVVLSKQNGFSNPVSLSVAGLPSATSASFSPNPVLVGQSPGDAATLTVQTNVGGTTPAGSYPLTITGTSDALVHSVTATLDVQAATSPNFSIAATPGTRTIIASDDTNYTVNLSRGGGSSGPFTLSATGLPAGATASFTPASFPVGSGPGASTLVVSTSASTPAGTYSVNVSASGPLGSTTATRTAPVVLVVQKNAGFAIAATVAGDMFLGREVALDLEITNPNNIDLKVTDLSVTVQNATSNPGCSGTANFKITQMPPRVYPLIVASGQTKKLSQLSVATADRPKFEMVNLPTNQDACLGATYRLTHTGLATKK